MPLQYSQFLWGFEVSDSGTPNNRLAFIRNGTTYDGDGANPAATLKAGVYTADELAAEVQRAMRERTSTTDLTCSFDYANLKFTIGVANPGNLSLLFAGTVAATDCNGLLGFNATNHNTDALNDGDSWQSDSAVGTSPSTAFVWTLAEPLVSNSPVAAQAVGQAAKRLMRRVGMRQNISDGGTIESIYFSSVKSVDIMFRVLSDTEQPKMEDFLDWIVQGRRFTWQPDKTSANGLKLVVSSPRQVMNAYEWLARPEVGYATFTFYEQLA